MSMKHPASVMALGVVASNGRKMPPFSFPCRLRVGAKEYLGVLQTVVKPWIDKQFSNTKYVFQQDSAPGHAANIVQNCLKENMAFWPKDLWPSSSPDLNPLVLSVRGIMESKARATSHPSIESLKDSIMKAWDNLDEEYIKKSCEAFRGRVEAIIDAEGGHIE